MNCAIFAFLLVLFMAIVWYVGLKPIITKSENMSRIRRGVGADGIAAGVITSYIIPDLTFTYFNGVEEESCDLCPNADLCPECPDSKSYFEQFTSSVSNLLTGNEGLSNRPFIVQSSYTGSGQKGVIIDADNTSYSRAVGSSPLYGGWGGAVMADTTTIPVSAFSPERDAEFENSRESVGASYTGATGRPNVEQFCDRGESFLSQPDEAFDSVRTASTIGGPIHSVGYNRPSCHIPTDNKTFGILYADVMGITQIDDGPSADICEIDGENGYIYKEVC